VSVSQDALWWAATAKEMNVPHEVWAAISERAEIHHRAAQVVFASWDESLPEETDTSMLRAVYVRERCAALPDRPFAIVDAESVVAWFKRNPSASAEEVRAALLAPRSRPLEQP
jgi:hypothetical protein